MDSQKVYAVCALRKLWITVNRNTYQFHPVIHIFGRGKFYIVFCQIHLYKLLLQINFKL